MNIPPVVIKRMRWLVLLISLTSVAIAQAQTLARPTITAVNTDNADNPDRAMVLWTADPAAVAYEVFVRGPGAGRSKASNEDAWHAAEAVDYHRFYGLFPAKTYTFRIRAIDAEGNKSQMSRMLKASVAPCWVFKKFWHSGKRTHSKHFGDEAPPKWAAENIPGCDDSRPKRGKWALPKE